MKGIYGYLDLNTCSVVYIGKDSNIHIDRRHHQHLQPSKYNAQTFNRVLQNNPERYEYFVFEKGDFTDDELNEMERTYVSIYNPRFNFTKGGDGSLGYIPSQETCKKISESNKGHRAWNVGKKLSDEHKRKLAESHKKNSITISKAGIRPNGKQNYKSRFNGKTIKESVNIFKLIDFVVCKYPNKDIELSMEVLDNALLS